MALGLVQQVNTLRQHALLGKLIKIKSLSSLQGLVEAVIKVLLL